MAELVRGITRVHLVALTVNCVIGSGILGLPAVIAGSTHSWALPVWVGCAAVVGTIALCQAEVGSRFVTTGGPYLYARQAFGERVGFLSGWLSVVTRILAFASVCNLLVAYASGFVPALGVGGGRAGLVLGVVVALSAVLIVGIRHTAWVSTVLTAAKLLLLGAFVVAGSWVRPTLPALPEGPFPAAADLGAAVLAMMFAFSGFEAAAIPGAETRDPRRDLPVALLGGLGIVTLVYLGVQHTCAVALPDLAHAKRPVAEAAAALFGPVGGTAIALGALVMLVGTLLTQLLGTSRLLYAMAERRELPAWLLRVDGRSHTPVAAILVTAATAATATLGSTFLQAVTATVATRVVTWGLICASLPVLRRQPDAPPAAWMVPGGDLLAGAACVASLGLMWASSGRELAVVAVLGLVGFGVRAGSVRAARDRGP